MSMDTGQLEEVSLDGIAADVTAVKADLDQLLPHLLSALKRNQFFEELQAQLRAAENVAQAWRDWPLVIGVHDAVLGLRAIGDQGPQAVVIEQLLHTLHRAGITEFGYPGETVDIEQVEVTAATGSGSHLTVADTQRPGLKIGHVPLRKAIVSLTRSTGSPA